MIGDEVQHFVGDGVLEVIHLRLASQNGNPVLQVGGRNVGHHAPLEAALEAVFEARNLRRRTVRGEHDLAPRLVECIERVEELLLRLLLAGQHMHVVDEQQVGLTVATLELVHRAFFDGVDHVVQELFGGDICDPHRRIALQDAVGNGLHEVGLAEPGCPVDEERVVRLARGLGDRGGGRSSELVGLADHEMAKRVPIIQLTQNDGIVGL